MASTPSDGAPTPSHVTDRFGFRFTPAYRAAGLCFAITPNRTHAVIAPSGLAVRFGPWRVATGLENIAQIDLTGPYAFLKTAGPARLALTDRGLTFATNGQRGVRLTFHQSIKGIEPTGRLRHPELTLTLADVDGFADRLAILGRDAGVAMRR